MDRGTEIYNLKINTTMCRTISLPNDSNRERVRLVSDCDHDRGRQQILLLLLDGGSHDRGEVVSRAVGTASSEVTGLV